MTLFIISSIVLIVAFILFVSFGMLRILSEGEDAEQRMYLRQLEEEEAQRELQEREEEEGV